MPKLPRHGQDNRRVLIRSFYQWLDTAENRSLQKSVNGWPIDLIEQAISQGLVRCENRVYRLVSTIVKP